MMVGRRPATMTLLIAVLALPLWAQTPEGPLAEIRGKTELTEEDRTAVRQFVTERVDRVVSASGEQAWQAADQLRAAAQGSDAFRRFYVSTCLEAIAPVVRKAELGPAAQLLTIVNTFETSDALPILLDALRDDRVGVRAAAAVGLRGLRPKLAQAGRDTWQRAVDALKEAGKQERSRDTLKAIYQALNYAELPSSPDPKANSAALLELLETRAAAYAGNNEVAALGADDTALRVAQALLRSLDENERRRLTVVVATMMRHAIERYTAGGQGRKLADVRDDAPAALLAVRNGLERLIMVGEELLTALLQAPKPPNVSDSMRKVDTTGMKNQWREWGRLLQTAVGQEFALREQPQPEPESDTKPLPKQ